ncbi:hypothetical protein M201_gp38 [Haloarcula californiae tailed virus 2]|uniref:Uncharacterized protein n=1 Tax=Haloarcula californiae tailed virus 2 TaxID=1273747 RepID=R4T7R0_9CAUD|nr:hypothetical protein M201_gp38 [Haloarcula californiae tailed virus 2]AGM11809.1 hypothetical protein HCTV2_38 [Haloarcula californiae tailed virus 2]
MTLRTTISTKLVRLPEVERGDEFPLPEGTNTLPQPLHLHGSQEDPDEFDLEDRLALHTVDDSPQQRGRRYAALERALAQRDGIERVTGEDGADSEQQGESTNSPEGDA